MTLVETISGFRVRTAEGVAGPYHKDTKTQRCRAAASRRTASGADSKTAKDAKSAKFVKMDRLHADVAALGSRLRSTLRSTIVDSKTAGGNLAA